jgi:phosphopantetheinyl transferase (holo-ACP synthase)
MVYGLGVDLASITRVGNVFARRGERFLFKFLNPAEIKECRHICDSSSDPDRVNRYLAGRYGTEIVRGSLF